MTTNETQTVAATAIAAAAPPNGDPGGAGVKKYRKLPVIIEARQLIGTTAETHAVYLWIAQNTLGPFEPLGVIEGRQPCPPSGVSIDPRDGRLMIATLEGFCHADIGDWIIRGVAGEFYPCKPDIFAKTYEPAP